MEIPVSSSRKIMVRKRDGRVEAFDRMRLASVIAGAIIKTGGAWSTAADLAEVIELYIKRTNQTLVSTAAVFEMAVKSLNRVGLGGAAQRLEVNSTIRNVRRRVLRVSHKNSCVTLWDKSWLAEVAQRSWGVSWRTARILAGEVETDILATGCGKISRDEIVQCLNDKVSQFGLADAVPVDQFAIEN